MQSSESNQENPLQIRLRELERETDHEFILELIGIFLSETPKLIGTIGEALRAQDSHGLAVAAHTLKGSAMNLGAKQLGALCLKLEQIGRNGAPAPAGTSTREVEEEFGKIRIELEAYGK